MKPVVCVVDADCSKEADANVQANFLPTPYSASGIEASSLISILPSQSIQFLLRSFNRSRWWNYAAWVGDLASMNTVLFLQLAILAMCNQPRTSKLSGNFKAFAFFERKWCKTLRVLRSIIFVNYVDIVAVQLIAD